MHHNSPAGHFHACHRAQERAAFAKTWRHQLWPACSPQLRISALWAASALVVLERRTDGPRAAVMKGSPHACISRRHQGRLGVGAEALPATAFRHRVHVLRGMGSLLARPAGITALEPGIQIMRWPMALSRVSAGSSDHRCRSPRLTRRGADNPFRIDACSAASVRKTCRERHVPRGRRCGMWPYPPLGKPTSPLDVCRVSEAKLTARRTDNDEN